MSAKVDFCQANGCLSFSISWTYFLEYSYCNRISIIVIFNKCHNKQKVNLERKGFYIIQNKICITYKAYNTNKLTNLLTYIKVLLKYNLYNININIRHVKLKLTNKLFSMVIEITELCLKVEPWISLKILQLYFILNPTILKRFHSNQKHWKFFDI